MSRVCTQRNNLPSILVYKRPDSTREAVIAAVEVN